MIADFDGHRMIVHDAPHTMVLMHTLQLTPLCTGTSTRQALRRSMLRRHALLPVPQLLHIVHMQLQALVQLSPPMPKSYYLCLTCDTSSTCGCRSRFSSPGMPAVQHSSAGALATNTPAICAHSAQEHTEACGAADPTIQPLLACTRMACTSEQVTRWVVFRA